MSVKNFSKFNKVASLSNNLVLVFSNKKEDTAEQTVEKAVNKDISFLSNADYRRLKEDKQIYIDSNYTAKNLFSFVSDGEKKEVSEKTGKEKTAKKTIRFFINGEKTPETERVNKGTYSTIQVKSNYDDSIPEMLGCYAMGIAYKMVIRALKTVYVASYNPFVYELWGNAIADSINYNRLFQNLEIATEIKQHKKFRDNLTGKFMKLENTIADQKVIFDLAKELDKSYILGGETKINREVNTNIVVDDLISAVYETICRLYRAKQITSFSDIKLQKGVIYSAVNRVLYTEKSKKAELEKMQKQCVIVHDDGSEEIITSHYKIDDFKLFLKDVEKVIHNAIVDFVPKRKDFAIDNAIKAYVLYHAFDYDQKTLSKVFQVKQQQISRWLFYVDRACLESKAKKELQDLL